MKVSQIASQLGLCRRRIDKWIQLDQLSERNRMQPRPGMPESFRDYLRQRWEAGCRHGRTLLAEIRKLGYVGCYSGLAKFLSPWRQPKAETRRAVSAFPDAPQLEATTLTGSRQLSPQVAAALLAKLPAELTSRQAQIVDTLKRKCPGFAVMRKLVFGFRAILRGGKVTTLHRWMENCSALAYCPSQRLVTHNIAPKLRQNPRRIRGDPGWKKISITAPLLSNTHQLQYSRCAGGAGPR